MNYTAESVIKNMCEEELSQLCTSYLNRLFEYKNGITCHHTDNDVKFSVNDKVSSLAIKNMKRAYKKYERQEQ